MTPYSGSKTSPLPVNSKILLASATNNTAYYQNDESNRNKID